MKLLPLPALTTIALFAVPVIAQGGILPYLPEQTTIAISVPDLPMSLGEFQKMPLARMWAEEEVQSLLADVKELVAKKYAEGLAQMKEMHAAGALPIDPDQLQKLRVNGGTFAVTRLELSMGDHGPLPKLGIVLHLDFGESAPTWNALIQIGLGMMEANAAGQVVKSESKIGDVPMLSFQPANADGIEMALNIAMIPGGVLIGTLADDVRGIVENMQKKTPGLAASAHYKATAKHLNTNGAECEVFVRFDPVVDFALAALRLGVSMHPQLRMIDMDGVDRAVAALGLRNLGSVGATSSYVDGKCVSQSYHAHPGAAAAPAAATSAQKGIDTAFLKWVPKDAVSFSAGTMNVAGIYDSVLAALQAYDPEFAKQAVGQLAEVEKQLEVNVRDDLFGSLGDHYISWSMPMGTVTSAPEVALLVKVNNEEKLVKVMKSLAQLSQGMVEIEEGEKRGLKAYQVRINFDPTQGMGMNPLEMFQPTIAFKGGYLVGGFSASDVKRVFQRMDREDDPKGDIRGNKEFAAIASTLPSGVDSVSFTDTKAEFESIYQIATGFLSLVPLGEDLPIDISLLPDSGTLTKHLFGSLSYSRSDSSGSETMSTSPFGPEVVVLAAAIVAGAAGLVVGRVVPGRGF
ncbi:MAG TPA: hypothetical protein VFT55_09840 [Planctomycetota bacterium]|nr:hypothetical protein [Planctomycetota bacterium]